MISEIDIRDWPEAVQDGYLDYIKKNDMNRVTGHEIWEAATHWAFEFMWARQEKAKSAWRKRQIEELEND